MTKPLSSKRPPLSTHLKRILLGWRPSRHPGDKERPFAAVYAAGPAHPVSKRLGDNRGCWPIRFGVIQGWRDGITTMLEFGSPLHWTGVLFRVWCPNLTSAQLLESLVRTDLDDRYDPLRKAWVDFGPELNVKELEKAVRFVAAEHNIPTWSDAELVKHLENISNEAVKKVSRIRKRVG